MVLFFDIDDTLVNQRRAEAIAAIHFVRRYARVLIDGGDLQRFCRRWREARERHLQAYLTGSTDYGEYHRRRIRDVSAEGAHLTDPEADARYADYLDFYRRAWSLHHDVWPALEMLQGFRLGIISNGNSQLQQAKLQQLGIAPYFSVVVISEHVGVSKPDPRIFLEAARRAGVAPHECVYVGDSMDRDAQASRAAGMQGIWIHRGGAPAVNGVPVVNSLTQLAYRVRLGSLQTSSVESATHRESCSDDDVPPGPAWTSRDPRRDTGGAATWIPSAGCRTIACGETHTETPPRAHSAHLCESIGTNPGDGSDLG